MEGLPGDPRSGSGCRPGCRTVRGGVLSGRRLVLWRHGRTAWNVDGRFQGQLDPPLDEVGRLQVPSAAAVLAALAPQRIVSSDLTRATDTATALSALVDVPVEKDERLREIHLGEWQGLSRPEVLERYPAGFAAWQQGADLSALGGESYAAVAARGTAAVTDALAGLTVGGLAVAVTHGGTARATSCSLLGLPVDLWWRFGPLGNCRWSVLLETERGWRLLEHNAGVPEIAVASEERAGDDAR